MKTANKKIRLGLIILLISIFSFAVFSTILGIRNNIPIAYVLCGGPNCNIGANLIVKEPTNITIQESTSIGGGRTSIELDELPQIG